MGNAADRLLAVAEGEEGYLEKASAKDLEDKTANAGMKNYTKYGAWYPMQAQPWCAVFVSWCAFQAGVSSEIIPKHASCTVGVNWFKSHGNWRKRAGYKPKRGDIIYYSDNGVSPCHVGIVCKSDDKKVYTVEGNTSISAGLISNGGGVAKKSYDLGYKRILGYGVPAYEEEEDAMTQERFNEMADKWIDTLAERKPAEWSHNARDWAETNGYINGNEKGEKQYKKFTTREELVQILYNIAEKNGVQTKNTKRE